MIKPTVGRVVLLTISSGYAMQNVLACSDPSQPLAAQIAYVHNDCMVNLTAWDQNGKQFGITSVQLLQDDDPVPDGAAFYCEWMPYQKGQAAKTEATEELLKAKQAATVTPDPSVRLVLPYGTPIKINGIPLTLDHDVMVTTHPANVPLIFSTSNEATANSSLGDMPQKIAKAVVFVKDNDGHNYYVPENKVSDFDKWLESEDAEMGDTPDWATRFDGEQFVVDIISEI